MLNILFKFVFGIVSTIAGIILAPINGIMNGLFGIDFSPLISAIGELCNTASMSLPFFIDFFCLPRAIFTILFTFLTAYITFFIVFNTVKFVINVYNLLKP